MATRFTVLVTAARWAPEAVNAIEAAGGAVEFMAEPLSDAALLARLQAAPVDALLVRGPRKLSAEMLGAARGLKIIAKNGAGIDGIDLDAARRLGLTVAVAAGGNADAVAEHTIALMLALVREVPSLDRRVRSGAWGGGSGFVGRDFRGSVLGLVGYGAIGRATAHLAAALGARVIVFRRDGSAEGFDVESDLHRLLPRVDILSLHCPLTETTRALIGAREFALLKPGTLLVNTARGAVVHEAALIDALRSGQLGGAALDTFVQEPLPAGHPLLAFDNVVLTPHVAGTTRDSVLRVALIAARNVIDHLAGRPLPAANVVVG